jgi:glutamate-1-semialdehyde aminotransferase
VAFGETTPLYVTHSDGYRAFDVNGNEYVDCIMGLGSVILGHRNPQIDEAIRAQLSNGTSMSLATPIELEAAERLLSHFPDDHQVQWATSGTDATTGACRLARIVTGKKFVVMAMDGYHGWNDWSLADSKRGYGIPSNTATGGFRSLSELYEHTAYNIAAVIIEPDLHPEWLKPLRDWTTKNGVLLIADEVMTWQRYPEWTGSAHYGIQPDIWCLGKSLGNGMPVSAIVGHKDIMKRLAPGKEPNAFFSSTWAGHPLSMAAVVSTLDVMKEQEGTHAIWAYADNLHDMVSRLLERQIGIVIGKPPFNRLTFRSPSLANSFRQLMAKHGVLIYASHNLSLAFDFNAMTRLMSAWEKTIAELQDFKDDAEIVVNQIMRR